MARYTSEKQRREAEAFKEALIEALHTVDLKQEAIADAVGTTQPTVSRWFSYKEPEFPDVNQVSHFPIEILVPICNILLKPFGLSATRPKLTIRGLNGSLDDELLNMDVIQAQIITCKARNPEKAKKFIEDLRKELDKAEAEVEKILRTDSDKPAFLRKIMD